MLDIRPTLALTVRALRQDTRLLRVHLVRFLFVLGILYSLVQVQLVSGSFGAPGLNFFITTCYLDLIVITIAGFGYFTTAISEEKEEQTIGLLQMAHIGPTAMLIGKSVPRLFGAMLILAAQFPFTLLAVTLGGVLPRQVVAAYGTLVAYLIFVAGLGVLASVVCRTSSSASRVAVVLLGTFLFGSAMIESGLSLNSALPGTSDPAERAGLMVRNMVGVIDDSAIITTNPFIQMDAISSTGFSGSILGLQVWSNVFGGAAFFGLARLLFTRFVRDEKTGGPGRSWFDTIGRAVRTTRGSTGLRSRRSWTSAIAWKDFYFQAGGLRMLLVKAVAYPALILFFLSLEGLDTGRPLQWLSQPNLEDISVITMTVMTFAFVLELALLAARIFREEIKWQTLATIALLPQSLGVTAFQKLTGNLISLVPCVVYFLFGASLHPSSLAEFFKAVLPEPGFWWFVSQVLLFIHLTAFLSLYVRWGALPLSFGLVIFLNACCVSTLAWSSSGGQFEPLAVLHSLLTFAVILALYAIMIDRLRTIVEK